VDTIQVVISSRRAAVVLPAYQVAAKVPVTAPNYRVHQYVGVGVAGQRRVVRGVKLEL